MLSYCFQVDFIIDQSHDWEYWCQIQTKKQTKKLKKCIIWPGQPSASFTKCLTFLSWFALLYQSKTWGCFVSVSESAPCQAQMKWSSNAICSTIWLQSKWQCCWPCYTQKTYQIFFFKFQALCQEMCSLSYTLLIEQRGAVRSVRYRKESRPSGEASHALYQ